MESMRNIEQPKTMAGKEVYLSKLPVNISFRSMISRFSKIVVDLLKPPEPSNAAEKLKQANSAPNILVDAYARVPSFEQNQGETRLVIPDDQKNICDTKSLSFGDTPFDWYPLNHLEQSRKSESEPSRKRVKSGCCESYNKSDKFFPTPKRPFYPIHLNCRGRDGKNRKEKLRHYIHSAMMDDYWQFSECSDNESESGSSTDSQGVENTSEEIATALPLDSFISFSEESFPKICATELKFPMTRNSQRQSNLSECESEDSFVIFTEDDRLVTPSVSPARRNLCTAVKKFLIPITKNKRQRLVSESSDESIIFCDDSDQDEESCADTRLESCNCDSEETLSQQPDSGFEEKKVRFNLRTEVHVMRAWNFAYRQARKGEWEVAARDRERFKKRIEETELILKPVLAADLRDKIYSERFCS